MAVIKEVAENVFLLELPVPVNSQAANVYLFKGEAPTLLDTGVKANLGSVLEAAKKIGIESFERVLITHWHVDHGGGAAELERRGARVLVSARDYSDWVKFLNAGEYNLVRDQAFRSWGVPEEELSGLKRMYSQLTEMTDLPREVRLITSGELIQAGDCQLRTILTPGHSAGHLCFWEEKKGLLFSGDHLLSDQVAYPGVWLEGEALVSGLVAYVDSLSLLEKLGGKEYFPGHGKPGTAPAGRCQAVRSQISAQIAKYLPGESVYKDACGFGEGANTPSSLFMKMHFVYGWREMRGRLEV